MLEPCHEASSEVQNVMAKNAGLYCLETKASHLIFTVRLLWGSKERDLVLADLLPKWSQKARVGPGCSHKPGASSMSSMGVAGAQGPVFFLLLSQAICRGHPVLELLGWGHCRRQPNSLCHNAVPCPSHLGTVVRINWSSKAVFFHLRGHPSGFWQIFPGRLLESLDNMYSTFAELCIAKETWAGNLGKHTKIEV